MPDYTIKTSDGKTHHMRWDKPGTPSRADVERFLLKQSQVGLYQRQEQAPTPVPTSRRSLDLLETPEEASADLLGRVVTNPRLVEVRPAIPPAAPLDTNALPRKVANRVVPRPVKKAVPRKPTPRPVSPEHTVSNEERRAAMRERYLTNRSYPDPVVRTFVPPPRTTGSLLNPDDAASAGAYWMNERIRAARAYLEAERRAQSAQAPSMFQYDPKQYAGGLHSAWGIGRPEQYLLDFVADYDAGRAKRKDLPEYANWDAENAADAAYFEQVDKTLKLPKGTSAVLGAVAKTGQGGQEEASAGLRALAETTTPSGAALATGRLGMTLLPGWTKVLAIPLAGGAAWLTQQAQSATQRSVLGDAGYESYLRLLAQDRAKYPVTTFLAGQASTLATQGIGNPFTWQGVRSGGMSAAGEVLQQAWRNIIAPKDQKPGWDLPAILAAYGFDSVLSGPDTRFGRTILKPVDSLAARMSQGASMPGGGGVLPPGIAAGQAVPASTPDSIRPSVSAEYERVSNALRAQSTPPRLRISPAAIERLKQPPNTVPVLVNGRYVNVPLGKDAQGNPLPIWDNPILNALNRPIPVAQASNSGTSNGSSGIGSSSSSPPVSGSPGNSSGGASGGLPPSSASVSGGGAAGGMPRPLNIRAKTLAHQQLRLNWFDPHNRHIPATQQQRMIATDPLKLSGDAYQFLTPDVAPLWHEVQTQGWEAQFSTYSRTANTIYSPIDPAYARWQPVQGQRDRRVLLAGVAGVYTHGRYGKVATASEQSAVTKLHNNAVQNNARIQLILAMLPGNSLGEIEPARIALTELKWFVDKMDDVGVRARVDTLAKELANKIGLVGINSLDDALNDLELGLSGSAPAILTRQDTRRTFVQRLMQGRASQKAGVDQDILEYVLEHTTDNRHVKAGDIIGINLLDPTQPYGSASLFNVPTLETYDTYYPGIGLGVTRPVSVLTLFQPSLRSGTTLRTLLNWIRIGQARYPFTTQQQLYDLARQNNASGSAGQAGGHGDPGGGIPPTLGRGLGHGRDRGGDPNGRSVAGMGGVGDYSGLGSGGSPLPIGNPGGPILTEARGLRIAGRVLETMGNKLRVVADKERRAPRINDLSILERSLFLEALAAYRRAGLLSHPIPQIPNAGAGEVSLLEGADHVPSLPPPSLRGSMLRERIMHRLGGGSP